MLICQITIFSILIVTDLANHADRANEAASSNYTDVLLLRVNSSHDVLMKEQMSDPTLKTCRSMANRCRGGY
jgi:hypothetical protein